MSIAASVDNLVKELKSSSGIHVESDHIILTYMMLAMTDLKERFESTHLSGSLKNWSEEEVMHIKELIESIDKALERETESTTNEVPHE